MGLFNLFSKKKKTAAESVVDVTAVLKQKFTNLQFLKDYLDDGKKFAQDPPEGYEHKIKEFTFYYYDKSLEAKGFTQEEIHTPEVRAAEEKEYDIIFDYYMDIALDNGIDLT